MVETAKPIRARAARKPAGLLRPDAPLAALRGVGPARAEVLARLGLASLRDLLLYAPRSFEPAALKLPIGAAAALRGVRVEVRGIVTGLRLVRMGRGRSVVRAAIEDDSGRIEALWFNQPWRRRQLALGGTLQLRGVVVGERAAGLAMPQSGTPQKPLALEPELLPRYALGAGIGQEWFRALLVQARQRLEAPLEEPLSAAQLVRARVLPLSRLSESLHAPAAVPEAASARRRIALEALLEMQARLVAGARGRGPAGAPRLAADDAFEREFRSALPFALTGDQQRALELLRTELGAGRPLRRLLQGDVGCGKTAVLVYACALAARAGAQAAFLAPTELLAGQHWISTRALLETLGVEVALLSAATPPPERARIAALLARGAPLVVYGTHALLAPGLRFARLALVVIDEQQRFGVAQRQALLDKGQRAHLLLATATPIPRTLALALYGELEPLVLRDKPADRGALHTRRIETAALARLEPWLAARLAHDERAYWILPRIDTGPGGRGAEQAALELARGPLGAHGIGVLHGRVDAAERARLFERFRGGASKLLVGTSLLEVGLDVAEATCIVIEGAERFGLAQLHQLRGRVGRGPKDAWCFVLGSATAAQTSGFGDRAKTAASTGAVAGSSSGAPTTTNERLERFAREHDGFRIAELDLELRGMGELVGLRQAGASREGLASIDLELWQLAREWISADEALLARYLAGAKPHSVA
jgi:ATP-dependent DNA helicase RecG